MIKIPNAQSSELQEETKAKDMKNTILYLFYWFILYSQALLQLISKEFRMVRKKISFSRLIPVIRNNTFLVVYIKKIVY